MIGRVTWWNNSTNCGFIKVDDEELFVHSSEKITIYDDELIEFSLVEKKDGLFIYNLKEIIG